MLIGEYFRKQELKHEKKQQKKKTEAQPCWEMIPHYPLYSCWEERLDKLINLSFSYLSASAAQISPPSKAVSSDIQKTPSHPQAEATVSSQDTKQSCTVTPLETELGCSLEWMGVEGDASAQFPVTMGPMINILACVCNTRDSLKCKAQALRLVHLLSLTWSDSALLGLQQWAYTSGWVSGQEWVSEGEAASLKSLPVNISHCETVWF